MINGIYGSNPYGNSVYGTSGIGGNSYDYKAQQNQLKEFWKNDKTQSQVTTLKKETASFLDTYANYTKELKKSAEDVTGNNLNKLLYGVGGSSDKAPTDANVQKTTDAVQSMVDSFNKNLTMLNKNADRGPGVTNQIARMVLGPAAEKSMQQVGVTVNKDGTLALDKEKLSTALKGTKETRDLATSIIGGSTGSIANGIGRIVMSAEGKTPNALVSNDISKIKGLQQQYQENLTASLGMYGSFSQMSMYNRGGAYTLSNMGAIGMLMNVMV